MVRNELRSSSSNAKTTTKLPELKEKNSHRPFNLCELNIIF